MMTKNKIYHILYKMHLADIIAPLIYRLLEDDKFKSVEIETTTECNRKCFYCPNKGFDRGKHLMDESLFNRIIDELASHGFTGRISPHFYGEPLMDIRLPNMLYYIYARLPKCNIVLYTNGDFLTKDYYDHIEGYVDKIVLTLYDGQTNRDKCFPKVEFKTLDQTGITNRGGAINESCINHRVVRCYRPLWNVVIDYRGWVVLCCNDYHSSVVLGDINCESLYDIWNKYDYKKLRKDIFKGVFDMDICKNCMVRAIAWEYEERNKVKV
jgi:radical SAM protein with 4Fe4S-binding SPASM domain